MTVLALGQPDVLPNVARRLSLLLRRHRVPGAQVALYHAGETEWLDLGELRHRSGQRVTRNAAFPIGSVTKAFTATLAMILVADGDLELDAPLGEYLPDLDEPGAGLTLRQVLSHTSGLACGPEIDDGGSGTPARYVREHLRADNVVLRPGVAFSYSNLGYVLAGHLIESITGMNWWEAMSSILLKPLGIDPAYIAGRYAPTTGRPVATGHSVNTVVGRTRPVRQSLGEAEAPAGALATSAVDLVALGRLHVDGGVPALLPPDVAAQLRAAVPVADPSGLADGWALGLAVYRGPGGTWYGHDGNAAGTACYLRIDPVGGWVVALTSNANTGVSLWRELLIELAGAGVGIEPEPMGLRARAVPPPPGCAGTYVNGSFEYLVLDRRDGLFLAVDDAAPTRLTCHQDLTFSVRDPASGEMVFGGRFLRDGSTGRIDAVQIGGRLGRRRGYPAHGSRHARTA